MTAIDCSAPAKASRSLMNNALRTISFGGLRALWRSRRALSELSPEQLSDIGITADAAAHEANRRVWDVPAHWHD